MINQIDGAFLQTAFSSENLAWKDLIFTDPGYFEQQQMYLFVPVVSENRLEAKGSFPNCFTDINIRKTDWVELRKSDFDHSDWGFDNWNNYSEKCTNYSINRFD